MRREFRRYANRDKDYPRKNASGVKVCRRCRKPISTGVYCCEACKVEVDVRCGFGVRFYVRQRDKGICADRGIDCLELDAAIRDLIRAGRYLWTRSPALLDLLNACGHFGAGVTSENVHHIVPVEEGGGCCGLNNLVTLCSRCHKRRHTSARCSRKERFPKR